MDSNTSIHSPKAGLSQKSTHYRWVVMAVLFISYVVCMADRSNIGTVLPWVKKEFYLNNFESGAISSFFFLGYAVSQIPAGLAIGKIGTRKIASVAIIGFSIITFLMGHVGTAIALVVLRFLLGLAEGPTPVSITSTINQWFPAKEKGTATGLFIASTQLAPVIAPIAAVYLANYFGWRSVFIYFAIPGLIMAIVWYIFVRSKPEESKHVSPAELQEIRMDDTAVEDGSQNKSLGWLDKFIQYKPVKALETNIQVLKSWNIWCDTIVYFFMCCVFNGMLTWIPTYLVTARHYSFIKMGFVAAMPSVGGLMGAILGGWMSDKIFLKRRKPTMLITTLTTAIVMFLIIHTPQNTFLVTLCLWAMGFFLNIGWPSFTSYPMAMTNKKTYSFAISIVNSGGNLGGFFTSMIIGALLDAFNNNFNIVFIYFVILLVAAFVLTLTMKEASYEKA